jgi:hypothetical protein
MSFSFRSAKNGNDGGAMQQDRGSSRLNSEQTTANLNKTDPTLTPETKLVASNAEVAEAMDALYGIEQAALAHDVLSHRDSGVSAIGEMIASYHDSVRNGLKEYLKNIPQDTPVSSILTSDEVIELLTSKGLDGFDATRSDFRKEIDDLLSDTNPTDKVELHAFIEAATDAGIFNVHYGAHNIEQSVIRQEFAISGINSFIEGKPDDCKQAFTALIQNALYEIDSYKPNLDATDTREYMCRLLVLSEANGLGTTSDELIKLINLIEDDRRSDEGRQVRASLSIPLSILDERLTSFLLADAEQQKAMVAAVEDQQILPKYLAQLKEADVTFETRTFRGYVRDIDQGSGRVFFIDQTNGNELIAQGFLPESSRGQVMTIEVEAVSGDDWELIDAY